MALVLIFLFVIFSIITFVTVVLKLLWLTIRKTRRNHTKATSISQTIDDKTDAKTKSRPSVHIKRLTGFDGPQYQKVEKHFREQWTKITDNYPVPPIPVVIYAIQNDDLTNRYDQYKEKTFGDSSESNKEWYFHGTSLKCDIIDSNECCDDNACGVCGISRNGFDLSFIGKKYQRFGRGIYLAPNSSKSNDYATSKRYYVNYKAQLLCLVACGNKHILFNDDRSLHAPPANYHSVYGKASNNGKLNYDELVVYDEAAINPQFIVVYGNRSAVSKVQTTSTNNSSLSHHYSVASHVQSTINSKSVTPSATNQGSLNNTDSLHKPVAATADLGVGGKSGSKISSPSHYKVSSHPSNGHYHQHKRK